MLERSKGTKQGLLIFVILVVLFTFFILVPLFYLFAKSFVFEKEVNFQNYINLINDRDFVTSFFNSIKISFITAVITTVAAFLIAFGLNNSNINQKIKSIFSILIILPMLLPTITYGFSIMYTFGNQGIITRFLGIRLFDIYGFNGLLLGFFIYTLPPSFLIINNSFKYVDKKYVMVSKLMGDSSWRTLLNAVIIPTIFGIANAFIISFVLSFTDFGLPASIAGNYEVIAGTLYQTMLGSIPDFGGGASIAMFMLVPAGVALMLQNHISKHNFFYDSNSRMKPIENKIRDSFFLILICIIIFIVLINFVIIFVVPFVQAYPYNMTFTWNNLIKCFEYKLRLPYANTLIIAFLSAGIGTVVAYLAALLNTRSELSGGKKFFLDAIAMITNTVPGMVLGLGYLFAFNKSSLKGTITILVVCNVMHFFTSPYLMAKSAFTKMTPALETTAQLMGDNWFKSIVRIIIPSTLYTIVEMFSYYYINSMVTISAIIFLVNARTAVLTTKIKELQHYAKFDDIFVLSALLFLTNILFKIIFSLILNYIHRRTENEY